MTWTYILFLALHYRYVREVDTLELPTYTLANINNNQLSQVTDQLYMLFLY